MTDPNVNPNGQVPWQQADANPTEPLNAMTAETGTVVPDVLRKCGRPVVGRGLSALTAWCHRAGTCPGSGAWTIGWR